VGDGVQVKVNVTVGPGVLVKIAVLVGVGVKEGVKVRVKVGVKARVGGTNCPGVASVPPMTGVLVTFRVGNKVIVGVETSVNVAEGSPGDKLPGVTNGCCVRSTRPPADVSRARPSKMAPAQ